jgi:hypothetical protein
MEERMSRTITGTSTSTVTLSSTGDNPVSIVSTAKITTTNASYALYGEGNAGQSWTITNAGVINAGTYGNGIQLGGYRGYVGASIITNQSGGTIEGDYGIRMYNSAASSIVNMSGGTIESPNNRAIALYDPGTVTNSGAILAPTTGNQQVGVLMQDGGTVINNAGGTISGYFGVILDGPGTVTNAGTIEGASTSHYSVFLAGGGTNRLIVDPGAVFSGAVNGGNGTLELASAASAGTLTATGFRSFADIEFDAGAKWTAIGNAATNLAGEIVGFTSHDTIDLTGFSAVSATYSGGALTLTNISSAHETLHFSGGPFNTSPAILHSDGSGGTDIVACFCAGTRIATPSGETAVQRLRIGDPVTTLSGIARPVKWIGRRNYTAAQIAAGAQLCPVLIRKDALAPGKPDRDLYVSPMHSLFIDEVLIPAAALINGVTVLRHDRSAPVEYIHIELADHDVVLAEGQPAETFIDDNSRVMFDNADEYRRMYGTDTTPRGFCAPRVEEGFRLEAVRRRLADRAGLPTVAEVPGKLLGHVERFEDGVLQGWVMDDANRTVPVELEVLVDDESVLRLVANGYRTDLDSAGFAHGRCAFSVALPTTAKHIGQVRAKRVSDGMCLPISCVPDTGAARLHASAP